MAKISELADGGNLLNDDELIVLRAGGNVRATVANLPEVDSSGNMAFADNEKATFGTGNDLEIFHDGSNSRVKDTGTGGLYLQGSSFVSLTNASATETYVYAAENGAVQLKYDNSTKLATTSTGVDVSGTVSSGDITITDTFPVMSLVGTTGGATWNQLVVSDGSYQIRSGTPSRLNISTGGDVSFYEDTGTTPKFFWDSSAESLGIGTSSPAAKLEIDGGTGSATSGGTLVVRQKGDTSADGIAITSSDSVSHRIWKDASGNLNIGSSSFPSSFVQDFNGNVGIGTDSPSSQLHVYDSAVVTSSSNIDVATFQSQTANVGGAGFKSGIRLQHTTDTDKAVRITAIQANDYSNSIHMGFEVSNSSATPPYEAMRLDSSGNLLVGKSSASLSTAGVTAYGGGFNGLLASVRDGAEPLYLNRLTSDGSIASFQKDGSTVGSIGTAGGSLDIGSGDTALRFNSGLDAIYPITSIGGGGRDGAVDLGISSQRFKDLYLSGGAYLGGTAAANKLDDYEEGTWTPTASNAQGFTLGTPTGANGSYTKIGRTVNLKCGFTSLDSTEVIAVGDRFEISGIPFNTSGNYTAATASAGSCFIYNSFGGGALATGSVTHSGSILIVFIDSVLGSPTFSNDFNIGLVYESA